MTYSVIDFTCRKCKEKYHGVLNGLVQAYSEYSSECPFCNMQNFIRNKLITGRVDVDIPQNSVPVLVVKVISSRGFNP